MRIAKKLFIIPVLLLICALITVGCSTSKPPTGSATSAPASPAAASITPGIIPVDASKSGGSIKMFINEPSFSLGYPPTMTGATNGQYSSVCLQTLFLFDAKYNLLPLLATGYTSDPKAKTITITLRKGVKFQDGSDFNADACKWNLDQYRTGGRPELNVVSNVAVVDNYTVRLDLSQFDNTVIYQLASSSDAGRMVSPTAFNKNGGKAWAEQNPVGTGPFQFVNWQKDVGVTWKRFDGYWGGKPYLDEIDMVRIADPTVGLMTFQKGGLDILTGVEPHAAKTMENEGKYVMMVTPEGQIPAIAGYAQDPKSPFANLKVRQAVSYAIDVKGICDSIGLGYYKFQNQWAVPETWGYSPNVVGYPYNPDKAKQLLAEAGYPNGFDTVLHFYNTGPSLVDESTIMQQQLKAVGVNVKLDSLQRAAFTDIAGLGKGWDGLVRVQGYSAPDPLLRYSNVIAGQNFKGILLPQELVDSYNAACAAPDFATKQPLVWKLESLATDKYCIQTFLYVMESPIFKSKRMHDDLYGQMPAFWISPTVWVDK